MRSVAISVLLVLLCVLSLMAPAMVAAPEDEEIPTLQIAIDERPYKVGDLVNITIYVTANGRPVDPDFPGIQLAILLNFSFSGGPPGSWEILGVKRIDKGVFESNFTIIEDHVTRVQPAGEGLPLMGDFVVLMGFAQYQGVQATALGLVPMKDGPTIEVVVDDEDLFPAPGDVVDITVYTKNGTMVDAHEVFVNLRSYDGQVEQNLGNLTVNRQSIGTYKASYTVPVGLDTATDYSVHAGASFPDYNTSMYLSPLFDTGFGVRFFQVFLQNVSSTTDESEIAVWVADADGNALEDIIVDIRAEVFAVGGSSSEITDTNTTGADGMAGFTLTHTDAERVDFHGDVTDGTFTQRFLIEAIIDRSVPEPSVPDEIDGFTAEPWDVPDTMPFFDHVKMPGDEVTTKYRLYNETGPVPNKRVNWYLIDRETFLDTNYTVIQSGFVVSDGNADFDLTYNVPPTEVTGWIMFEAVMWNADDERYERMENSEPLLDSGFFPIDESIIISVDRVTKDAPVELRARTHLPDGSFIGHMYMLVDEETGLSNWGEAMLLGPDADDFFLMPLPKVGPDLYGIDKTLPEFFPEDQAVGFVVLSVDIVKFSITVNYALVGFGESTEKGVDASVPTPPEPILAGANGTFDLLVDNTGMGTDTYTVTQVAGPAGWLSFDDQATVGPAETGTVPMMVDVPTDADEMTYHFDLLVESKDATVNTTVGVDVEVMVNGIVVTVDTSEHDAFRQDTVNFVVTLNNTGQGNDTYALALEGSGVPWASMGQQSVFVQEGSEGEMIVQVDVPDDADEGDYLVNLTATSSDGETSDVVTLVVHVFVDAVAIEANENLLEAWPGEPVTFTFIITNDGQGRDTFTLTLKGEAADWATLSKTLIGIDEGKNDTVTVGVIVPAGEDEDFYDLVVRATSANGVTTATSSVEVQLWVSGVGLESIVTSKDGYRGEALTFIFTLSNTGDGTDVISLTYRSPSWPGLVTFDNNMVSLDEDAWANITLTVTLPDDIDEGTYSLTITATSEDDRTTDTIQFEVEVTVNGVEVILGEEVYKFKQGESTEISITVKNTGQGEDTITITFGGDAADWVEIDRNSLVLVAGAEETLTATIKVPKKADTGDTILNITVTSSDSTFTDLEQLQFSVKKADDGPGMGVVTALLATGLMATLLVASRRRRA